MGSLYINIAFTNIIVFKILIHHQREAKKRKETKLVLSTSDVHLVLVLSTSILYCFRVEKVKVNEIAIFLFGHLCETSPRAGG